MAGLLEELRNFVFDAQSVYEMYWNHQQNGDIAQIKESGDLSVPLLRDMKEDIEQREKDLVRFQQQARTREEKKELDLAHTIVSDLRNIVSADFPTLLTPPAPTGGKKKRRQTRKNRKRTHKKRRY
jgi:hypothetical protein